PRRRSAPRRALRSLPPPGIARAFARATPSTLSPSLLQEAVDPLEQLRVAGRDAREPLDHDAEVERDDKCHERFERHADSEFLAGLRERLSEHGAPLCIDKREALAHLGAVPREGLKLEPHFFV